MCIVDLRRNLGFVVVCYVWVCVLCRRCFEFILGFAGGFGLGYHCFCYAYGESRCLNDFLFCFLYRFLCCWSAPCLLVWSWVGPGCGFG